MIMVVDDEQNVLEFVRDTLLAAGHEARTFQDANVALEHAATAEPDLIISDVMMPAMRGFEFRRAYSQRFPRRTTPFIFLSSRTDADSMIQGLDLGADDYLHKPIAPELLKAKVRSHLRRKQQYSVPVFHGDLEKLPFVKLLQYCELKALTGEVEVIAEGLAEPAVVRFAGGELAGDPDGALLEKLLDLASGRFTIRAVPVDFAEIESSAAARAPTASGSVPSHVQVMGRLSGVRLGDRLFQVQTEVSAVPDPVAVSVVILDGKTVLKRVSSSLADRSREDAQRIVNTQHTEVEQEVQSKLQALADKAQSRADERASPQQRFQELYDEGLAKYLKQDYAGSLALWDQAAAIDPNHKVLGINLKIVRKKLEDAAN